MDVSADGYWSSDWLDVTFADQDLLGFLAQGLDAVLWEGLAVEQLVDLSV